MNQRYTQHTIRKVPLAVDNALRRIAKTSGKSLNSVTLEVIEAGLDVPKDAIRNGSLESLFGVISEDEAQELILSVKEAKKLHAKDLL